MKLLRCYVENFGALSAQSFEFDASFTQFCLENGAGKSTLAAFLKAMFYGMPSYTSTTKDFPERKHYHPFHGGNYGGNVTFEWNGKEYRIERFFDEKSETKDQLKVYCNGSETKEFGKEVGEKVFGINADSFSRTMFVTSQLREIASSADLNAQLGQLTQTGVTAQQAEQALLEASKKYRPQKATSSGEKYVVLRLENELHALREKEQHMVQMRRALDGLYTEQADLQRKTQALQKSRDKAFEDKVLLERWNHYDSLQRDAAEKQEEYRRIRRKYAEQITQEDLAVAEAADRERLSLSATGQSLVLSVEARHQLDELQMTFAKGIPTQKTMEDAQRIITRLESDRAGEEALLRNAEARMESCRLYRNAPSPEEMQWFRQTAKEMHLQEVSPQGAQTSPKKRGRIAAAILAACAVLLMFVSFLAVRDVDFVQRLGSAWFLCAYACLAAAGGCVALSAKRPGLPKTDVLRQKQLQQWLQKYGFAAEGDLTGTIGCVLAEADAWERAAKEYEEAKSRAASVQRRNEAQRAELTEFFRSYRLEGDLQQQYRALTQKLSQYDLLRTQQKENSDRLRNVVREIQQKEDTLRNFFVKYGVADPTDETAALRIMRQDAAAEERLQQEAQQTRQEAEAYRVRANLTERPQTREADMEEIEADLQAANQKLKMLDAEIDRIEEETQTLEDVRRNVAETAENLQEANDRYFVLSEARRLLEAADFALKQRYVKPVQEQFGKYAALLEQALGEQVKLNRDLSPEVEKGGRLHSDLHLSEGQRTIVSLCFRLALLDEMFRGNQPFLILDDPFVHLDEKHLARVKALLKELSANRQILYFCCHESRKL